MREGVTRFLASRPGIILVGAIIGLVATLLQKLGNPPNMGVCVACFQRDIAGALGLHRADVVQYIRPEIIGFVLGSLVAARAFHEFKARTGSAPVVRFFLGVFAMIGALTFLGCPWRALLRLAGGDWNAIVGLVGLGVGISIGVWFLKQGYTLGRTHRAATPVGWIIPLAFVGLLLMAVLTPSFIFASQKGPGSMHAALWVSLLAGLIVGALAQRTRFCTMGSIRDVILARDTHLISGVAALVVVAFVMNLILGQFKSGTQMMPIAHSAHVWNFLGLVLAGLCFALAGGCPGRQLFLAGEGDGDAGVFVLGMITGAAFAHNFGLAAKPDAMIEGAFKVGGVGPNGQVAVILGLVLCIILGFAMRERWKEA